MVDPNSIPGLMQVLIQDREALVRARKNYGESWCKRGGVGAFMMLARKWDRLENFLSTNHGPSFQRYDILEAIACDKRPEGIIDDIRDLRRYLALVEAKAIEMGICPGKLGKDDEKFSTGPIGDEAYAGEDPTAKQLHP